MQENTQFLVVTEQLTKGDINAWIRLFHSFAFRVDLKGNPVFDKHWMSPVIEQLEKQIRQGDSFSMALLGTIYLYGWGELSPDYTKALSLIKRAAGLTNSFGEFMLGFVYLCGWSVAQDNERALNWFNLAAKSENPMAYNMLGYMYEKGWGDTKKNLTEALAYYRKSAAQNISLGMYNLGRCYAEGVGISQDDAAAFRWQTQAATYGNAIAQNELAQLYEQGRGSAVDLPKAIHYYVLSARTYGPAQENLARLQKAGHREVIETAKKEAGLVI